MTLVDWNFLSHQIRWKVLWYLILLDNHLLELRKIFYIIIYWCSWKASSSEDLFSSRQDSDLEYFCSFNFRLFCRLLQESHRKDKALLRGSILCRLVCHLENRFFNHPLIKSSWEIILPIESSFRRITLYPAGIDLFHDPWNAINRLWL